ncbi:sigma 54-interacting transcriptional regulator [Corallococcus exercitus]|uniref:sigma 54-interacting transcriptional regulator n=1 Tax=Corallococcus exercitus TaxID=2316736 RepID=UPI0035D3E961
MFEAWIRLVERSGSTFPVMEQALQSAGVKVKPVRMGEVSGPGLLVFDEVAPATLEAANELRQCPEARVLGVATSSAVLGNDACWMLLDAGLSDVLAWDRCASPAAEIAARLERWLEVDRLIASPLVQERLVGRSAAWLGLLRQIVEAAAFTDSSVLLLGESGTGKEEVARLIHALDPRPDKRELVTLDCTTVVPELSGSEFFGHERGAFTGAANSRDGAFALADGGTLFLDEVGELPLKLQAQLLRVVQEQTYKRVGGNSWQHTRFRLICATNRDLAKEVEQGGFRRDFFHRISSWICHLPPLSKRMEDLLPLVHHFLQTMRPGRPPLELEEPVREYLLTRDYPGNVRDLRQLVSRICKSHVGDGPITVGDIPPDERPVGNESATWWQDTSFTQSIRRALRGGVGLKDISRIASDTAIRLTLAEEQGSLQRAARRLGVTDRALQLRKAQWGNQTADSPSLMPGDSLTFG